MEGDAGCMTIIVTFVTLSKECVCWYIIQRRRLNDDSRDRQTYKVAMSSNLLPERHCSKTYTTHIVSDSLLLGVIVHTASIL
jgi:hypothetical protein